MKTLLFAGVLIAALGVWAIRSESNNSQALALILVPTFFVVLMMSPLSWPIWKYWIIQTIQFPWRLLILLDLSIAFSLMLVVQRLLWAIEDRRLTDFRPLMACLGASAALIMAVSVTSSEVSGAVERSAEKSGTFMVAGAPEYIPPLTMTPVIEEFKSLDYKWTNNEEAYQILFGLVEDRADEARRLAENQTKTFDMVFGNNGRIDIALETYEPRLLTIPVPYWKYWTATDEAGQALQISAHDTLGVIQVIVPEGKSALTLQLKQTRPEQIGSAISIIGLILLVFSLAWGSLSARMPGWQRPASQFSEA